MSGARPGDGVGQCHSVRDSLAAEALTIPALNPQIDSARLRSALGPPFRSLVHSSEPHSQHPECPATTLLLRNKRSTDDAFSFKTRFDVVRGVAVKATVLLQRPAK